ncbi:PREDICTED: lysozyme-like [Vollenhovia emeryi]|uniref:lysozyme-like n=1 Tax=Vollenhovia emeryi TaxID=411798 RepID=UPI0005F4E4A8|nr:PREDICTED: lysozyme-like [Vollenhovia emeryi]
MFAKVPWVAVTIIALFCVYTSAQTVPQNCIGCMCEMSSGCNTTIGCMHDVCGPFAITWGFWSDAGKPTLNDEPVNNDAYSNCVNEPYCAARTVEKYMFFYGHDCTGDGVVDCHDFVRIHQFGPLGCTRELSEQFENKFKLCLRTYEKQ